MISRGNLRHVPNRSRVAFARVISGQALVGSSPGHSKQHRHAVEGIHPRVYPSDSGPRDRYPFLSGNGPVKSKRNSFFLTGRPEVENKTTQSAPPRTRGLARERKLMRIDHRIRSAINRTTHAAGVEYAAKLRESLLERAEELMKAKTPPAEIATALALPFPSSNEPA